jgi:hypothetical protein
MNFLENNMKPTVTGDLAMALIGYKDAIVSNYYTKWAPDTGVDTEVARFGIEFEEGNKYVKIVSVSWGSRSVHSFVEKATGDIWKAASWKAPARNFARGNVFAPTTYLNRTTWTGVV